MWRRGGKSRPQLPVRASDFMLCPKSQTVAGGCWQRGLVFLDGPTGRKVGVISRADYLESVAYSRDGSAWPFTRARLSECWTPTPSMKYGDTGASGMACDILPDGALLAASNEPTVLLLDAATGQQSASLPDQSYCVWLVVFSPDGALLACASIIGGGSPSCGSWEVAARQEASRCGVLRTVGRGLAFSPDGKTLAISGRSSRDRSLGSRDLASSPGDYRPPERGLPVAFSPDGNISQVAARTRPCIWDAVPNRTKPRDSHLPMKPICPGLSADGSKLWVLMTKDTFAIWMSKSPPAGPGLLPDANTITSRYRFAFLRMAAGCHLTRTGQVRVWDSQTLESLDILETGLLNLQDCLVARREAACCRCW